MAVVSQLNAVLPLLIQRMNHIHSNGPIETRLRRKTTRIASLNVVFHVELFCLEHEQW